MSFLNGFLDNVVSGALNPKGNLADYAHGSRLFVDDNHRLSPKVKFLYHVTFNINPAAAAVFSLTCWLNCQPNTTTLPTSNTIAIHFMVRPQRRALVLATRDRAYG